MKEFKRRLISQKTIGQQLKSIRVRKKLSLTSAEEKTRVRLKYLQAFEQDDLNVLPDEVYAIGFLERYLEFLEVPKQKFITQFKQELASWKSLNVNALTPKKSVKQSAVLITPNLIFSTAASLVVLMIVGYVWFQAKHLTAPPELIVVNPGTEAKVALEAIEINGKTDPGSQISINNEQIPQDTKGNFTEKVALQRGVNTIEIIATNRFNKQNTKTITVLRTDATAIKQEGIQDAQR